MPFGLPLRTGTRSSRCIGEALSGNLFCNPRESKTFTRDGVDIIGERERDDVGLQSRRLPRAPASRSPMRLLDLDALAGLLVIGGGKRLVEVDIKLARRIVDALSSVTSRRSPSLPRAAPRRRQNTTTSPISIAADRPSRKHADITQDEAVSSHETAFHCLRSVATLLCIRSLHRMDCHILFWLDRAAAGARSSSGEVRLVQACTRPTNIPTRKRDAAAGWRAVDRLDLLAQMLAKRIEFESRAILLDDWNGRAKAAFENACAVDPGVERRQGPANGSTFRIRQASVRIGEPQFAIPISRDRVSSAA